MQLTLVVSLFAGMVISACFADDSHKYDIIGFWKTAPGSAKRMAEEGVAFGFGGEMTKLFYEDSDWIYEKTGGDAMQLTWSTNATGTMTKPFGPGIEVTHSWNFNGIPFELISKYSYEGHGKWRVDLRSVRIDDRKPVKITVWVSVSGDTMQWEFHCKGKKATIWLHRVRSGRTTEVFDDVDKVALSM